MKVLLTNTYFYKLDPKQWRARQPYPPYGTLSAAAVLQDLQIDLVFFDNTLQDGPESLLATLRKENPDVLIIYDDGFNYLTKMCLTVMRDAAITMAKSARDQGCQVIISSSDSTDHFLHYLQEGADFVILGEGEQTLLELINAMQDGKPTRQIPGIACLIDDTIHRSAARPVIKDLDTLPIPAWSLLDPDPYRSIWLQHHGYFSINIATTRGCPFKCNWCAKPIYGNRYHSRSPRQVVEEIQWLVDHFGIEHIWMCDDIFGLKPGWVQSFNTLLEDFSLQVPYKIQSRVDLLLKEDNLDALVSSGVETVWVGAESGSQKVLDAMDKGTTIKQIEEATRLLHERGVKVGFFLQFGYLGETQSDIKKTIHMLLKLMPDDVGISVSYPLPGTKFHEKVKDMLGDKTNWSDSDDLAMMYQSTFNPSYYRKLHRYVHRRFRKKQAAQRLAGGTLIVRVKAMGRWLAYSPLIWLNRLQLYFLERQET